MFSSKRKPSAGLLGLLAASLLVATVSTTSATTTSFQANDFQRALGSPSTQDSSTTVTRTESVPHGMLSATVAVSPKPIKLAPKPRPKHIVASRTRRLVAKTKTVDLSKYPYYARPHAIHHGSNCPDGPTWVKSMAKEMSDAKFGGDQWYALEKLWTHESNFNPWCENSSGAYGVPQALPGSKMGGNWRYDVRQQITWGLGYIKGRYGTPAAAYAHWRSHGWY